MMTKHEIIAAACRAYMEERWGDFRTLAARLDPASKRELSRALFIP